MAIIIKEKIMVLRRSSLSIATITALAILALTACGGPSESDIQATVAAAVQSTAQAQQVAVSVKATQEAAEACGTTALNTYADTIEEQLVTFEAQTSVAGSTPRASLGAPLQKLVDLQTETRRMKAPPCLKEYHERAVSMMGAYRLGYETFAAQGDETLVQASIQVGRDTLASLKDGLKSIRAGKVPTLPTPLPTPKS